MKDILISFISTIPNSNRGQTRADSKGKGTTMAATSNSTRIAGVNPLAIEQAILLDDTFFDTLEVVFNADMIKALSPVVVYNELQRVLSSDNAKGIADAWPRLGSGRTEDGEVDTTCVNPDWTKTLNGKRTVWVSYFDTMILRSKRCMAVQSEIDNLTDLAKNEKSKGKLMDYEDDIKTLNKRLSSYKATFRKGIKLLQQVHEQQEYFPDLKLVFSKDQDGNVKSVTTPIRMWPETDPLLGASFTVTEFNSLDFETAAKTIENSTDDLDAEKRWEILMLTAARGTPDDEDEEDPDNLEVSNFKRFETSSASMLYWLNNSANTTKIYSTVDKGKIEDHADFIRTLVELADELGNIANHLRQPRKGGKGSLYEQAVNATASDDENEAVKSA